MYLTMISKLFAKNIPVTTHMKNLAIALTFGMGVHYVSHRHLLYFINSGFFRWYMYNWCEISATIKSQGGPTFCSSSNFTDCFSVFL